MGEREREREREGETFKCMYFYKYKMGGIDNTTKCATHNRFSATSSI